MAMKHDGTSAGDEEFEQDPGNTVGFAEARCEVCGREIRDDDDRVVEELCRRCGVRFLQFLEKLGRRAAD